MGFLLGSYFFLKWCRGAGLTDDQVYSLVNRAAIGSIIGARVAYVINHPGDFDNPLEIFAVWKGGISLLGGIGGAVLAGVPKMRSEGLSFWKVMDLAVPGVIMGIVVGRVGDLVIADHLGKPTDFFLGYVCPSGGRPVRRAWRPSARPSTNRPSTTSSPPPSCWCCCCG